MPMEGSDSSRTAAGSAAAAAGSAAAAAAVVAAAAARPLHARSFKLRFAAQSEPGRSYVSLVKPLGLPATVTGKFYRREESAATYDEATRRALRRIQDMFTRGPRDHCDEPLTTSQVYGWHVAGGAGGAGGAAHDRRLDHRIRDSAWLKERLRVLAADDKLKQR